MATSNEHTVSRLAVQVPDVDAFNRAPLAGLTQFMKSEMLVSFVNGLQWKRYKRYDMSITGESACADSWGKALSTKETSISIPCFAERRYATTYRSA